MSDDLVDDDMVMDLDLNQEPLDHPSADAGSELGSLLNDLQTAHSRIEERIRQLEAVTARALQRHRWRQARTTFVDTANVAVDRSINVVSEMQGQTGESVMDTVERNSERGCKRDSSHLVAKALEMDLVVNKVEDGGSFFDCNICLDMAREPILTCCGHLYCWPCFFQLPYVDSTTKECPVCKGEVADASVTPIYGNGNGESITELESGLKIPPRPKANRVESARQQRATQGLSHIPVAEALRRIRTSIGLGHQTLQRNTAGGNLNFVSNSQLLQNADPLTSRRLRSRLFSRVLSEGAASLSSELDNAQRMFEDLAASLTDRLLQRSNADAVQAARGATDDAHSFRRDAAFIQSDSRTLDAVAETSSPASIPSSSQANEVSDTVVQLENITASLSSQLDSAQRMLEDYAPSLTDRLLQRSNADALQAAHGATDNAHSFRRDAAFIQSDSRTLDAVAETSSPASIPSSSQANEVSDTVVRLENLTTDTGNLHVARSSLASRRRSILQRLADIDSGVFRETRRRRLNPPNE